MLSGLDMRQIYQTVSYRLRKGLKGPPDSFTDEEKAFYKEMEESTLRDRAEGRVANYDFPEDYD